MLASCKAGNNTNSRYVARAVLFKPQILVVQKHTTTTHLYYATAAAKTDYVRTLLIACQELSSKKMWPALENEQRRRQRHLSLYSLGSRRCNHARHRQHCLLGEAEELY